MYYKAEDLWNKDSPYLEHKFGFKYILKLPVGKTFRYFYNQAEIAAYKAKKTANGLAKNTTRAIFKTFRPSKNKTVKTVTVPKMPGLEHTSGTDPKGYKYVGKVKIDGKTRYFYSEEEYEAYRKRALYEKTDPEWMNQFKKTNGPMTAEEDAVSINPKYSTVGDKDYRMNCQQCTFIYEMRRRGYDVEYNEKYNYSGADGGDIAKKYNLDTANAYCFEGATVQYFKKNGEHGKAKDLSQLGNPTGADFKKTMKTSYPPNSRGNLIVVWKSGGAHSMVWETNKKGEVTIRDTQVSGKGRSTTYDPDRLFRKTKYVATSRLDNLKPKKTMLPLLQNRKHITHGDINKQEQILNSTGRLIVKHSSEEEYYKRFSNTQPN